MSLGDEKGSLSFDDKDNDSEGKKSSRIIALIFTPIVAIIFLTFVWSGLRTVVLYLSAFCLIYVAASTYIKNG